MPKKSLAPGQEEIIPTSGLYLSIINATSQFYIEAPEFGSLVGKVGRQYELVNISEVLFVNSGVDIVDVEYEVANIKVHGSGSGTVSIENEIVVKRINESISVEASIENGSVFGIDAVLNQVRLATTGNTVKIDPLNKTVDIAGQTVDISGQVVDVSGQTVDISGQVVNVSGQTVDISGQVVNVSGQTVDIDGQTVDIDGQSVKSVPAASLANTTGTIPVALGQILAANLSRASVVIIPDVNCYLGGAGVSATNARLIEAGQPWKITGTYAVYAVGESGAGSVDGVKIEEESY